MGARVWMTSDTLPAVPMSMLNVPHLGDFGLKKSLVEPFAAPSTSASVNCAAAKTPVRC